MTVWIDTHCHLDAPEFGADLAPMRARAAAVGVAHCVLPAVQASNFDTVRELAHRFGDSYALGIHPLYTPGAQPQHLELLGTALSSHGADSRLVAVGEIGLDYFVPGLDRERQAFYYREQLKLARHHGLPVILHVRRSADQLVRQLRDIGVTGGIAHAFNGSQQQARAFLDLGFKLGLGGAVTFERALQLRRLAAWLPLDAIVLETDAPDIPPHWRYTTAQQRADGLPQGRNEPAELPRIAAVVAQLRGMAVQELALATCRNAQQALPRLGRSAQGLVPGVGDA